VRVVDGEDDGVAGRRHGGRFGRAPVGVAALGRVGLCNKPNTSCMT